LCAVLLVVLCAAAFVTAIAANSIGMNVFRSME